MGSKYILVTGGCGYIGSHLVKALSETEEKVIVLDDLSSGTTTSISHDEKLIVGDIRDGETLRNIFQSYPIDTVFHFAALVNAADSVARRDEYLEVNAEGARRVFETAAEFQVKHFIYASSAVVYGNPHATGPLPENIPLAPTNPYGESKILAEKYLRETASKAKANYVIFRFFNVAGAEKEGILHQNPGSHAIMQRLFAVAAGQEKEIVISGSDYATPDGTVIRDFVHVEDITAAHLLALQYLGGGGKSAILNLGTGVGTSMKTLVGIVEKVTGKNIPIRFAPRNSGDIGSSVADISLATKMLNWHPSQDLETMVRDGWLAFRKML